MNRPEDWMLEPGAGQPDDEERFRRRRERMEAAFAEAMTPQPGRFTSAVPDEVDAGDRHVVAAAFAARRRDRDEQRPTLRARPASLSNHTRRCRN
jgi:hypothetical protein